jgi:TATA-binding protein-associated factor Taf7
MQSETPESFRELCARAQKETDIETVEEIVDRLLRKDKMEAKQMSGSPKNRLLKYPW